MRRPQPLCARAAIRAGRVEPIGAAGRAGPGSCPGWRCGTPRRRSGGHARPHPGRGGSAPSTARPEPRRRPAPSASDSRPPRSPPRRPPRQGAPCILDACRVDPPRGHHHLDMGADATVAVDPAMPGSDIDRRDEACNRTPLVLPVPPSATGPPVIGPDPRHARPPPQGRSSAPGSRAACRQVRDRWRCRTARRVGRLGAGLARGRCHDPHDRHSAGGAGAPTALRTARTMLPPTAPSATAALPVDIALMGPDGDRVGPQGLDRLAHRVDRLVHTADGQFCAHPVLVRRVSGGDLCHQIPVIGPLADVPEPASQAALEARGFAESRRSWRDRRWHGRGGQSRCGGPCPPPPASPCLPASAMPAPAMPAPRYPNHRRLPRPRPRCRRPASCAGSGSHPRRSAARSRTGCDPRGTPAHGAGDCRC